MRAVRAPAPAGGGRGDADATRSRAPRRRRLVFARLPRAARWCALAAFLNAFAWSLVTPIFHVPDENAHLAYLQHLAETGRVPNVPDGSPYAAEEAAVLDAVLFNQVVGRPYELAPWSEAHQRALERAQDRVLARDSGGGIIESSGQPPLYYALGAAVYRASPWKGLAERVTLLRLMSAVIAAVTVLFVYLFLRELLAEPWTWTVGALAVAFQPLFGFVSSGLNPDTLLFAASAALLFTLARAFRRGFTPRLGLAVGAALAAGALTKLAFFALVPGALLALGLLVWRSGRARGPALAGAGAAVGVLAAALVLYGALNTLAWDRPLLGGGVENAATDATAGAQPEAPIGWRERLSYTWQLYLPRLPFMNDQFGYFQPYETWFKGFVGIFGWLDTRFPAWTYELAIGLTVPLLGLLATALWRRRAAVRARLPELAAYAAIAASLLASIGFLGVSYRRDTGFGFEQARYLLPLASLYAAAVALAALGAGRRLGRPLGVALVTLALAHGLFGQLLVIARFYA